MREEARTRERQQHHTSCGSGVAGEHAVAVRVGVRSAVRPPGRDSPLAVQAGHTPLFPCSVLAGEICAGHVIKVCFCSASVGLCGA